MPKETSTAGLHHTAYRCCRLSREYDADSRSAASSSRRKTL